MKLVRGQFLRIDHPSLPAEEGALRNGGVAAFFQGAAAGKVLRRGAGEDLSRADTAGVPLPLQAEALLQTVALVGGIDPGTVKGDALKGIVWVISQIVGKIPLCLPQREYHGEAHQPLSLPSSYGVVPSDAFQHMLTRRHYIQRPAGHLVTDAPLDEHDPGQVPFGAGTNDKLLFMDGAAGEDIGRFFPRDPLFKSHLFAVFLSWRFTENLNVPSTV